MKPLIFFFMCIVFSCSNKIIVQNYPGSVNIEQKYFYTLPANTIDFECRIKKETYTRGNSFDTSCLKFVKVGVDSFDLDEQILKRLKKSKDTTGFTLLKDGFSWSEATVPDSSKVYIFRNQPSFLKDNSFSFAFNRDWMISSATVSSENKTFEILTTFLSSITSTATALMKGGKPDRSTVFPSKECDSIFLPLIRAKKEYQNFLIHPPDIDGEGLQMTKAARIKNIEKLIENIFYKKEEEISVVRFSLYIPEIFKTNTSIKIFKIDRSTGKVNINDILQPYIIWPKEGNKITYAKVFATDAGYYTMVSYKDQLSAQQKVASGLRSNTNKGEESGIVYNVPMMIRFYLKDDKESLIANSLFPVAQLGSVNYLSQKNSKADFTLDSLTGSLSKITTESKSLATSKIATTGGLIVQVDSSLRKSSEIEKLQKEASELELRVKIKELREKLQ